MKVKEYEMPDGRKAVFEYDENGVGKITLECMDELMGMIAEAPTIDIVRCKECRYCHRNYVDMTPPYQHDYCYKFSRYMNADDFCSYGEREGE